MGGKRFASPQYQAVLLAYYRLRVLPIPDRTVKLEGVCITLAELALVEAEVSGRAGRV